MNNEYMIGIDAGGTKITALAVDMLGNIINRETVSGANIAIDFDHCLNQITEIIKKIIYGTKGKCVFAAVGVAGIETGDLKHRFSTQLKSKFCIEFYITNDAEMSLVSATKGNDGILIISGTGSIGYIKQNGNFHRYGGWGHLISDEGSGYWIGLTALKTVIKEIDDGKEDSDLKKTVFSHLSVENTKELISFVYSASKREVAALSKSVSILAENKDKTALKILKDAGEQLFGMVFGICNRFDITEPNVFVSGGVLKNNQTVLKKLEECISKNYKSYKLETEDLEPAYGVYYICRNKKNGY